MISSRKPWRCSSAFEVIDEPEAHAAISAYDMRIPLENDLYTRTDVLGDLAGVERMRHGPRWLPTATLEARIPPKTQPTFQREALPLGAAGVRR